MGNHELMFLIFSYIMGSIPTGFIVYKLKKKDDVRKSGSGNTGATNILRTCGGKAALVTLLIDFLKGAITVTYGIIHFKYTPIIIAGGSLAVIGHIFPIWLKFRGGKGVATFSGIFFAYMFSQSGNIIFPVFIFTFFLTLILTKYVSVSSLTAVTASFFAVLFTNIPEVSIQVFSISILILFRHRDNIARLGSGEEDHIFWRGK